MKTFRILFLEVAVLIAVAFWGKAVSAATFVVDRNDDSAAASACTDAADDCSLRGAISAANAVVVGADTITLPAGTYTLTVVGDDDSNAVGDLDITGDLTINGAGARTTIVTQSGAGGRILDVVGGTVAIAGVTIRDGEEGGVSNSGTLNLTNCVIKNNHYNNGLGSGIVNGIGGTLTIQGTTISGNKSLRGGGIYHTSGATALTLKNSTVSGNFALEAGGGLFLNDDATIQNSTITNNKADCDQVNMEPYCTGGSDGDGNDGGGIYALWTTTVSLSNSIVAGNEDKSITKDKNHDCSGTIDSQGHNLIQDTTGCTIAGPPGGGGNITGQDPKLGNLANNGGETDTHLLQTDSPALDAGNPAAPGGGGGACEATDQRGGPRPVQGANSARCDMGAVEVGCGNGIAEAAFNNEACDDGNAVNTDACTNACALPACGDGFVQAGEECDNGGGNSDTEADACRAACLNPSCGDGVVDAEEECDDGNGSDGDGCSSLCQAEEGSDTDTPPSVGEPGGEDEGGEELEGGENGEDPEGAGSAGGCQMMAVRVQEGSAPLRWLFLGLGLPGLLLRFRPARRRGLPSGPVEIPGPVGVLTSLLFVTLLACSGGSQDGQPAEDGEEDGEDQAPNPASEFGACGSGSLFTVSPIAYADTRAVVPLGNLNPAAHTFPTGHIYFYIRPEDPANPRGAIAEVPVYFPADATITGITSLEYLDMNPVYTDYKISFQSCDEVEGYLDHVKDLKQSILDQAGALNEDCTTYNPGDGTVRACSADVRVSVAAGTEIGTAGGAWGSQAMDFGAFDGRIEGLEFANAARAEESANGFDPFHVVCPIDYYPVDVRTEINSRFGNPETLTMRTVEPLCGEYEQDETGTAQGKWYVPGTTDLYDESPHLALVHDNIDPSRGAFSVGTSVTTLPSGTYFFHPKQNEPYWNVDFDGVTSDGQVTCYDGLENVVGEALPPTYVILISMPTSTTIRIEKRDAANFFGCRAEQTWTLSSAATEFER